MRRLIRRLVRIETTVAVLVTAWLAGALALGLATGRQTVRGWPWRALWIRVSGCLAAGLGGREPLVAEIGDDLQLPTDGLDIGGEYRLGIPQTRTPSSEAESVCLGNVQTPGQVSPALKEKYSCPPISPSARR